MKFKRNRNKIAFGTLFGIFFVLIAILAILIEDKRHRGDKTNSPMSSSKIIHFEIWLQNDRASFRQEPSSDPSDSDNGFAWYLTEWTHDNIQESLTDHRVRQGITNHFIELLQTSISHQRNGNINLGSDRDRKPYLKIKWRLESGDENELFVFNDSEENLKYGYYPKERTWIKISTILLKLLEGKSLRVFRDQRVSTLRSDDIEELVTEGGCGQNQLLRNGSQWDWLKVASKTNVIDVDGFLDQITEIEYESKLEDPSDIHFESAWCRMNLKGRLGVAESVKVVRSNTGKWYVQNSAYSGVFEVPNAIESVLLGKK